MDEKKKAAMLKRFLRGQEKALDYEEQKERKQSARIRKSERRAKPPRRRNWADAEDDEAAQEPQKNIRNQELGKPARTPKAASSENLTEALVVGLSSGRAVIAAEGQQISARLSTEIIIKQQSSIAVGDRVLFDLVGGQARIQQVLQRQTCISRPDPASPSRERALVANIDLAVIVTAAKEPGVRPGLIDRFLIALDRSGVEALICINKLDLVQTAEESQALEELLFPYRALSTKILLCSVHNGQGISELSSLTSGRTSVFLGHSGVGKSSLLNAIDPRGGRKTNHGRAFDGKGRHTTSSSSLRPLPGGGSIIDTPGLRSFGLWDIEAGDLWQHFPDLAAHARQCRFSNCLHSSEPDCGVRQAANSGALAQARYASYLRILQSL